MKLSAPLFVLKGRARALAQQRQIPLHKALNNIATAEGFASWSLLSSKVSADPAQPSKSSELYKSLAPGDLLLIGARPKQGKTKEALALAIASMQAGHRAMFFSLEYNLTDLDTLFARLGHARADFASAFEFDNSDHICSNYIIGQLGDVAPNTLVVVDYLQLLDEQRSKPSLETQISELRAFAKRSGAIFVFLSQVHRRYEESNRPIPIIDDIRLPNPLDLGLFDQACFLQGSQRALHDLAPA